MMVSRLLLSLLMVVIPLLASAAFCVSALSPTPAHAQAPIVLKIAGWAPPTHGVDQLKLKWMEEIEKRTNNRVKFQHFPAGTLLKADNMYDGIVTGVADVGDSFFAWSPGRFPLMGCLDLPLGFPSSSVASRVVRDVYRKFKPKELSDAYIMHVSSTGPPMLATKKPVRNLDDLKGMKIRTPGVAAETMKLLGAAPVVMSMGESYDALAKGVVEGCSGSAESLLMFKLAEVSKYVTKIKSIGFVTANYTVMNLATWNRLPPDIQKIFEEINEKRTLQIGEFWDVSDQQGYDHAKKLGLEIIELSPAEDARWVAAVQPVIEKFTSGLEAKGLPAKEVVKYIRECIAKYTK